MYSQLATIQKKNNSILQKPETFFMWFFFFQFSDESILFLSAFFFFVYSYTECLKNITEKKKIVLFPYHPLNFFTSEIKYFSPLKKIKISSQTNQHSINFIVIGTFLLIMKGGVTMVKRQNVFTTVMLLSDVEQNALSRSTNHIFHLPIKPLDYFPLDTHLF